MSTRFASQPLVDYAETLGLEALLPPLDDTVSLAQVDHLCCNYFFVHPCAVYGDAYWTDSLLPDISELEERLEAGEFATKREFWIAAGDSASRYVVRRAMLPDYRAMLDALPDHDDVAPPAPPRLVSVTQLDEMRELRGQGWTQKRLADAYGVGRSTVSELLSGVRLPAAS